jgi:ABC-type dipeptide/oligopeptide/nickel transport system permease component
VINLILVEHTFSVQGFFLHTWKATGHSDNRRWPPFIDFEMLTGIAVWGSLFVVVLSYVMDFALLVVDPRIRTHEPRA